jgi:hypothetical protein
MADLMEVRPGPANDEVAQSYREISAWAVFGLVFGFLALTSFLHPGFLVLAVAGIAINAAALARIKSHDPPLLGRKAALFGLILSLIAGVCAPVPLVVEQRRFNREAEQVGVKWLKLLARQDFAAAHQLTMSASMRWPANDVEDNYRQYQDTQDALIDFIREPVTQALASLGDKVEIRFLRSDEVKRDGPGFGIMALYAASFRDKDELKSFLIKLSLIRQRSAETGVNPWQVDKVEFLTAPPPDFRGPPS